MDVIEKTPTPYYHYHPHSPVLYQQLDGRQQGTIDRYSSNRKVRFVT